VEFASIYLSLEFKDLITAWEEQLFFSVEDFKNGNNETVVSTVQQWIKEVPEVLHF